MPGLWSLFARLGVPPVVLALATALAALFGWLLRDAVGDLTREYSAADRAIALQVGETANDVLAMHQLYGWLRDDLDQVEDLLAILRVKLAAYTGDAAEQSED